MGNSCLKLGRVFFLYYDRRSVGQSVLSGTHLGPATKCSPYFFKTVAGLLMWGALSDERSGLQLSVVAGHLSRVFYCLNFLDPPNLKGHVPVGVKGNWGSCGWWNMCGHMRQSSRFSVHRLLRNCWWWDNSSLRFLTVVTSQGRTSGCISI
jgi:hypothetical protein